MGHCNQIASNLLSTELSVMVHVKFLHSLALLACAAALAHCLPQQTCYAEQLYTDQNFDLSFICNDGRAYPKEEIEKALYYAHDYWRIYLNLTSVCFQENDNFFTNEYSEPDYYNMKCVCNTNRTLIHTIYAPDGQVCWVVRPHEQRLYYASCGGQCNLGYGGVNDFHCIQRGITQRNFLGYCRYPDPSVFSQDQPLYAYNPARDNFFDPRLPDVTFRMQTEPLRGGKQYVSGGYFSELQVTVPTYCGCRGYFCN